MSDATDGNDALDYDSETNTYWLDYDPRRERPSIALVSAVATITGRHPSDLPLLQESVAPESLDELFRPTEQGRSGRDGRIEFGYADFAVTVYSYGGIELRPEN